MKSKQIKGLFSGYGVVASVLMLAVAAWGMIGCFPEEEVIPPGQVQVKWRFSGTCESTGVVDVRVMLSKGEATAEIVNVSKCEEGELTIESVPPGTYVLAIEGLNEDGKAIYRANVKDEVKVESDELTEVASQNLKVIGADIRVEWRFENGKFCGNNGVETVEVRIEEAGTGWEAFEDSVDCNDGFMASSDFRPSSYEVYANGLNEDGDVIFSGFDEFESGPADDITVDLILIECSEENPCTP